MDHSNGASLGSPGSPTLDGLDLEPNQGRNTEASLTMPGPVPWNLFKFYSESDTSPWTPVRMAGAVRLDDHRGHRQSPMISNHASVPGYPWQSYRSNAPSDCGTVPLPSDSGYSSQHPRPGMDTASICTGGVSRDQDLQSVTGQFSRAMNGFGQEPLNQNQDVIGQMGAWREPPSSKLWCAHCQKAVKTRSELKKHEQRHMKPWVCDESECPRKQQGKQQGFSTKNDLERHKKTVHNKSAGVHYRCHLDQCKPKNKLWPRADNFRSHLKRIHNREYTAEDSLDAFVDRQTTCSQEDLEGVGSAVDPLYPIYPNSPLDISPGWPSMELDAPQDRMVPRERCQDDHQRSELTLDSPRMQFPAPMQGPRSGHHGIPHVQRTLDLIQTSMSLDSSASAQPPAPSPPAQRTYSGMSMPPPRSGDKDVPRSFRSRRPISGRGDDPSAVSSVATNQIESRRQILLPMDANTGASHHPQQAHPDNAKTPPAGAPANGKKLVSSPPPNIANLHEQNYDDEDEDGHDGHDGSNQNHADIQIERCGGLAPASASASVKDSGEDGLLLLQQLPAVQGLGEEAIMKFLEQVPQHLLGKFMKKSTSAKKGSPATVQNANASGANRNGASNTKHWHDCPDTQCGRKFPRKCELKKHMKRHEKPYCCTFPPCPKRFGSKSDWRRHENTQHYQGEMWVCDMKKQDTPTEQCIKKCYRRESFKQHLQREHQIEDQNKLEEKFEKCRVERHCDSKFWCGFCERSFDVTPQSPMTAQTERANHMDDHFSGRSNVAKKEMSEWKSADPDLPEMDLSSPPEDDEECSSPQNTPSSATSADNSHESESSGSSQAKSKRRRVENDAAVSAVEARQSKRPRNDSETSQMWLCCQCSSSALVKTTPVCLSSGLVGSRCDHHRCNNCQIASHTPNESKQRGPKNIATRIST